MTLEPHVDARPAVLDMDNEDDRRYALHRAINRLRDDDPVASAAKPVLGWQKTVLWVLLAVVIGCLVWQPLRTTVVMIGLCTAGYLLTMFDRVLIFRQGLAASAIRITDEEAREIPDDELPLYTILVPAYNEPEVVGDLIGAMAALEYPREKLQILLLLEADDEVTITAARDCAESDAITVCLVPPADPRTKPKACNYGLHF
ncbi:MAG: N-acetylglucosaminyltransferase, partial [Mycobacterium sp.]|nr:N-acetylglucosaminyltransferase [Mycobacterium sp.]